MGGNQRVYLGFSHGAAGIGYFLLHLGRRTKHEPYLQLAREAAAFVLLHEDHEGEERAHWWRTVPKTSDYRRIQAWREDFGDFDPFGDFELLFPAAVLGLGIMDIPIRYLDRRYGSTNIDRFRHGAQLLKMSAIGLSKIKSGPV